jgi:acyl-CoA synthetase (AMP-forming)/AMP-acid ligase II/drug/metabolite transporter (DMT)-like permease
MIPLSRIEEIVAFKGDQTAIIAGEAHLSWSDFAIAVRRFSARIYALKANPHTIAFLSPNRTEILVAAAAAATIKATFFGIDYSLDEEAITALIEEVDVDCLIVSSNFLVSRGIRIRNIAGARPIIDLDANPVEAEGHSAPTMPATAQQRAFRAISFTSGTSGKPKAVLRKASFDQRRFTFFAGRYGFSSADRHLVTIPLYHAAGNGWARLFLQLGATVVLASPDDPVGIARLIRSEWITTTVMTPPILSAILRLCYNKVISLQPHQLRFLLVGGKHFPISDKLAALQLLGPVIYEYYGTTETGVNTIAEPADLMAFPESVGRAYEGNSIIVVNPSRKPVPHGVTGAIAIHSYMNMDGYHNQASETIEVDGKTFLVTPEQGFLDEEGRLYLHNRSQGQADINLYALENAVRRLAFVADVTLIPDGKNTNAVVDCVVAPKDHHRFDYALGRKQIEAVLARAKIKLRTLVPVEQIPYSPSGKIRLSEIQTIVQHSRQGAPLAQPAKAMAVLEPGFAKLKALLLGIALLMFTTMSWGGMFPVAKAALVHMDGYYLTLFRYGFASVILCLILGFMEGKKAFRLEGQAIRLFLYGSIGFAGFSILVFVGLAHTKAEHGAIIMALMPLITVLLTWMLKGVRPRPITFACIVAALLGVTLVVTKGSLAGLMGGNIGADLLILIGAACWVVYTLGAATMPDWSALRYTALSAAFGTVTIALVTMAATSMAIITMPSIADTWAIRYEIAYLVIVAAVLAVFSWNIGIKLLGPLNGVLFINLVPVTAFGIGVLQGRQFETIEMTGAALTIMALLINNLASRNAFTWPKALVGKVDERLQTPRLMRAT